MSDSSRFKNDLPLRVASWKPGVCPPPAEPSELEVEIEIATRELEKAFQAFDAAWRSDGSGMRERSRLLDRISLLSCRLYEWEPHRLSDGDMYHDARALNACALVWACWKVLDRSSYFQRLERPNGLAGDLAAEIERQKRRLAGVTESVPSAADSAASTEAIEKQPPESKPLAPAVRSRDGRGARLGTRTRRAATEHAGSPPIAAEPALGRMAAPPKPSAIISLDKKGGTLRWGKKEFTLGDAQARVIEALLRARRNGRLPIRAFRLKQIARLSPGVGITQLFRGSKLWSRVVTSPKRGFYALKEPRS